MSVSVQTWKESRISSSFVLSLPVFGQRLEGSNKTSSRVPPPVALRGEWVVRHCALVAVLLLCEGWSVSIQKKFSSFYDMLLTAQQHNKGDDKTTPKRRYQTDVARHTKQCTQFSNTMSALKVCKFEGRGHALSTKAPKISYHFFNPRGMIFRLCLMGEFFRMTTMLMPFWSPSPFWMPIDIVITGGQGQKSPRGGCGFLSWGEV